MRPLGEKETEAPLRRIGLIGLGTVGRALARALEADPSCGGRIVGALVRPHQVRQTSPGFALTDDLETLLAWQPDLIVEAAGQVALSVYGENVLRSGVELLILSIGALADATLYDRLVAVAMRSGTRLSLASGAIAGLDALRAMRESGPVSVWLTSTKRPIAWQGTKASQLCDLEGVVMPVTFFEGNAAEAARTFPRNANLAAAVALAGAGFERTRVCLVADPNASGNISHLRAVSSTATLETTLVNQPSDNPKTSRTAYLSVLAALRNGKNAIRFS